MVNNEYLPSGQLPLTGIEQAVENAALVLKKARDSNIPVFHIRHEFLEPDIPFFQPGSKAVEIQPAVAPVDDEPVIVKNHVNAFKDTNLKQLLDDQGILEVIIVGAMSHMCVDAAVRAAADFGYKVTVLHDACATLDLEFDGIQTKATQAHAAMMAAFEFGYGEVYWFLRGRLWYEPLCGRVLLSGPDSFFGGRCTGS